MRMTEQELESYINILFTKLLRTLRDVFRQRDDLSREGQIIELLSDIEENYETCTLTEMGKVFGKHGNYLTAFLKEKTGRSFAEHVQEQRLKKARMLLEDTDIATTQDFGQKLTMLFVIHRQKRINKSYMCMIQG